MPVTKYIQTNFTSGVFSKKMRGRIDLARYYNAADTIRNWLPLVQGGVTRRPGFHFVDYPKYNDKKCRLIPFDYGVAQAYILEVGDQYMRFYKDGALIRIEAGSNLVTNGDFASDLTGWTDYSVSPGTAVWDTGTMKLDGGAGGIGSRGQSFSTVNNKTYLLRFDVITDNVYLRIGTTEQGTEILNDVLVTPGLQRQATFIARASGSGLTYIQFLRKSNGPTNIDNVVCKLYDPIEIASPYLEAELNDLKWAQDSNDLYIAHSNYWPRKLTRSSDTSWSLTTIDNTVLIDGPFFAQAAGSTMTVADAGGGNATLTCTTSIFDTSSPSKHIGAFFRVFYNSATWGCIRITSVANSTTATGVVTKALGGYGAGQPYREGRFSTLRGFPRSVVFHEGRLVFGGANTSPQTFCGSMVDDPYNMTPTAANGTVTDNHAIQFTIGSNKVNLIRWLASGKGLVVGTNGGMFRATASPITPSSVDLVNETTEGSGIIQGIRLGQSIIFVERGGSQVLEATYDYNSDGYAAQDLSVFADDLMSDGISDMVYQSRINPTLWFYKPNGDFLALTYRKNEKVAAWSEHNTLGDIESMAVISDPTERWDDVYAVVKRTINSVATRTIEYLDPYINVDSGLSAEFANPVSILSGVEHLIGELVDVVGDSASYPPRIVDANGQITLDPPASNIEVGLHYDAYFKTLKPEIKSDQGTIQPCKKKWTRLFAKLVDTVGINLNGEVIPFRSSLDLMDQGITPFTGDKEIFNLGWEADGVIEIEQNLPLSATVLCIFGTLEINE